MSMKKAFAYFIVFAAAVCAFSQTSPVDYYYIADFDDVQGTVTFDKAEAYSISPDEIIQPQTPPDENSAIHLFLENGYIYGGVRVGRVNMPSNVDMSVYSLESTVSSEFWIRRNLTLVSDWIQTVSSDVKYSSSTSGARQLRFAVTDRGSKLAVGGNMELNTSKYFVTRVSNGRGSVASSGGVEFDIGGALAFNFQGASDAEGYHIFDMRDSQSKTTGGDAMLLNLGGLSSSGKAVFMTAATSATANFNFTDDDSGNFAGGSFEGIFAVDSSAPSSVNIYMNGSGRQSMSIYKSANAAAHGFGSDLDGMVDMAISSVSVNSGEFVLESELQVQSIYLSGGSLKFSSPEKANLIIIDGGRLVFGGTIKTADLAIGADSIEVVFSAEDLAANEIVVMEYNYCGETLDPQKVFLARGESGEDLGGMFEIIGESGSGYSLIYTVPEPAVSAAIFAGMAVLALLCRSRKKF